MQVWLGLLAPGALPKGMHVHVLTDALSVECFRRRLPC